MPTLAKPYTEPIVSREDFVLGVVISSGFRMRADGWLYPTADSTPGFHPLVRVYVSQGRYTMERRRTPEAGWMQIVSMSIHEFDQAAFESWVEHWPQVAPASHA